MQKSVEALVADLQLLDGVQAQIVQAVRELVQQLYPGVREEVKYGGILFTAGVQFGGVFAYRAHVSVEFGHGAHIVDSIGLLEGAGKGRRHLKLRSVDDIAAKQLATYLPLAHQAAAA